MPSEITNPISSGGGGGFFEAKVQASLLLPFLIAGRVPCLPNGSVQSVRLQARQAGFSTDDIVLTLLTEVGVTHRFLGQVKHHAAIAKSDGEFCAALQSGWADFNSPGHFTLGLDVIALITGPRSDRSIQHVRPLLDWARTSGTPAEFFGKVSTANFSSDEKRHYLSVFREVIDDALPDPVPDEKLWSFLRHFYLLSYDFDVQGSEKEAAVLSMIDLARRPDAGLDAEAIWQALVDLAQTFNRTAGTVTTGDIPQRLREAVDSHRSPAQRNALDRLREHTALVLGLIDTELAPGLQLPRSEAIDELINTIEASCVVVVQGAPGCGKSALVKMLAQRLEPATTVFAFKAQEFKAPHLHQFLTGLGIGLSLEQLKYEFSLLPRKILLVDAAEKLFELGIHEALKQLLRELTVDPSWTVVLTARESAAQDLQEHLLGQWGIAKAVFQVPPPWPARVGVDCDAGIATSPAPAESAIDWTSSQSLYPVPCTQSISVQYVHFAACPT